MNNHTVYATYENVLRFLGKVRECVFYLCLKRGFSLGCEEGESISREFHPLSSLPKVFIFHPVTQSHSKLAEKICELFREDEREWIRGTCVGIISTRVHIYIHTYIYIYI